MIRKSEIESVVEMDVANCIYDHCDPESEDDYVKKVINDLFTTITQDSCIQDSNVHRFNGRKKTEEQVRPIVRKRIEELKAEGYDMSVKEKK